LKKSKFSEEQIVRILSEAAKGDKTVAEVCREHGASQNTFYIWKRKYSGVQSDDLKRLRELERENSQLKRLVADKELENLALREISKRNF